MSTSPDRAGRGWRWFWRLAFSALVLYVAARMGAFALTADVAVPSGTVRLPNTFASVDHPFHVTRAATLWDELASGQNLRWVGQHQGGYPVEFYPLGEAWLEVMIRAVSLGALSAQGAHTLAVVALFLLPGLAFAALARLDGWPVAVAFLAFALHVSLPGSWYHGGYTELVQWGLVTNVAGSVAALLTLPAMVWFLRTGAGWAGAISAALAAWAVYCNPRSVVGLAALGAGTWVALVLARRAVSAPLASARLGVVVGMAALVAGPLLLALARFGGIYKFVHYSGYERVADYAAESIRAVSWPVFGLGCVGVLLALTSRRRPAATAVACSLLVYVAVTATIAFVPPIARLTPQLEPTRLMPLQRFLVIYLAAVTVWVFLDWALTRFAARRDWAAPIAAAGIGLAVLIVQTRPLAGPPPDPASPVVPPVSLYAVAMSAQPQQFDLELAMRAADEAAAPGTAILVIGSALSWHQQLWAPLWTARPLFYDNWLWYWHPDHAGTPGYRVQSGHHYPDPAAALEPDYLETHGVGAVVVTGSVRGAATSSPRLEPIRTGVFDTYAVLDPVTTVTFGDENAALLGVNGQQVDAVAQGPGSPVVARVNWYPRWGARADERPVPLRRLDDGYMAADPEEPARTAQLTYQIEPLDWLARVCAVAGLAGLTWMIGRLGWPGGYGSGWYARQPVHDDGPRSRDNRAHEDADVMSEQGVT